MRNRENTLDQLVSARRKRLEARDLHGVELTRDELQRSTKTAMRLADASASQVSSRAGSELACA